MLRELCSVPAAWLLGERAASREHCPSPPYYLRGPEQQRHQVWRGHDHCWKVFWFHYLIRCSEKPSGFFLLKGPIHCWPQWEDRRLAGFTPFGYGVSSTLRYCSGPLVVASATVLGDAKAQKPVLLLIWLLTVLLSLPTLWTEFFQPTLLQGLNIFCNKYILLQRKFLFKII